MTLPDRPNTALEEYTRAEAEFLRNGTYSSRLRAMNVDFSGFSVLDLGAGPGVWQLAFAELGASRLVWHDRSAAFHDIARRLHQEAGLDGVEYHVRDLLDMPYPEASFDLVMCRLALPYASNEWRMLEGMARLVKPGGYVYIEAHSFRWTWTSPTSDVKWKYPIVLATPLLALVTRRKLVRTKFSIESFVRWYLRKHGFEVLRREQSEEGATFRLLCRR